MTDHNFNNVRIIFKEFIRDILDNKPTKKPYQEIYHISTKLKGGHRSIEYIKYVLKYTERYFKRKYLNEKVIENLTAEKISEICTKLKNIENIISKVFFPIISECNEYFQNKKHMIELYRHNCVVKHYFYYFFKDFLKRNKFVILESIHTSLANDRKNPASQKTLLVVFDAIVFYDEFSFYHEKIEKILEELYFQEWSVRIKSENVLDFFINLYVFLKNEKAIIFLKNIFSNAQKNFLARILSKSTSSSMLKIFRNKKVFKVYIQLYSMADCKNNLTNMFLEIINYILDTYLRNSKEKEFFFHLKFILKISEYIVESSSDFEFVKVFIDKKVDDIFLKYEDKIIKIINTDYNRKIIKNIEEGNSMANFLDYFEYFFENKRDVKFKKRIYVFDDDIIFFFKRINDKTSFSEHYRIHLSNRIFFGRVSLQKEKDIIKKLKLNVPALYLHKLDMMIKDVEKVKTVGKDMVLLINPYRWPKPVHSSYKITDKDLKKLESKVSLKKAGKETSYKLNWCHVASTCDVEINGKEFLMTIIQYKILKLLISGKYKREQIISILNLQDQPEHLKSLIKSKLIKFKSEYLVFGNKIDLISKNLCPRNILYENLASKNVDKKEDKETWLNHLIDCKVIEKLKSENKLEIEKLYAYIINISSEITKEMISKRLDYLIRCDFIQLIGKEVIYLP